jgi:uncharacterized protein (DUF433 family)
MPEAEILAAHPDLERDDIHEVLSLRRRCRRERELPLAIP